jgi:hypothetical protein
MNTMFQLIAGALVGGFTVWYWGDDLRRYGTRRGRAARARAAEAIQSAQDRADAVIDAAKERVGATLQAGQEAIRPRGL